MLPFWQMLESNTAQVEINFYKTSQKILKYYCVALLNVKNIFFSVQPLFPSKLNKADQLIFTLPISVLVLGTLSNESATLAK